MSSTCSMPAVMLKPSRRERIRGSSEATSDMLEIAGRYGFGAGRCCCRRHIERYALAQCHHATEPTGGHAVTPTVGGTVLQQLATEHALALKIGKNRQPPLSLIGL
uniref:Uncharacterized protein n=1 Tax=Anopheles culicifacies TaxID=139723 RepID=A0A182MVJ1_9DIPT